MGEPSLCLLVRLLRYNPENGLFMWRVDRGRVKAGTLAGTQTADGYVQLKVDYVALKAHRVAWALAHGRWPDGEIDHWDGVHWNNAFRNLRECGDDFDNRHNQRSAHFDNATGFLGVSRVPGTNKFRADLRVKKEHMYLGRFDTAKEAHAAYLSAKREHHTFCTI